MDEPALYCGTYGKYNDGSIAGTWLKLSDYPNAEAFLQACLALHKDEPDPEFMFQDFEHFPRELYGESMGVQDIQKIYDWLQLDERDRQLVAEYADATGDTMDGELDVAAIEDRFFCELDRSSCLSDAAAMGDYVLDNGLFGVTIPDDLQTYIDREAIGRDWLMDMSVSSHGYVFTNY